MYLSKGMGQVVIWVNLFDYDICVPALVGEKGALGKWGPESARLTGLGLTGLAKASSPFLHALPRRSEAGQGGGHGFVPRWAQVAFLWSALKSEQTRNRGVVWYRPILWPRERQWGERNSGRYLDLATSSIPIMHSSKK